MESTLHRQLKATVGASPGGREEVRVLGYRIDAVAADGELVEIQNGTLAAIRPKLARLLESERVRVIKPVVLAKRISWKARRGNADAPPARKSPYRGRLIAGFSDLVSIASILTRENLRVELMGIEVEEVRVKRRRWPGHAVVDRSLIEVLETRTIAAPSDFWDWLDPDARIAPGSAFTTADLATHLDCSADLAQKVAYCLRHAGAASDMGKLGHRRLYARPVFDPAGRAAVTPSITTLEPLT